MDFTVFESSSPWLQKLPKTKQPHVDSWFISQCYLFVLFSASCQLSSDVTGFQGKPSDIRTGSGLFKYKQHGCGGAERWGRMKSEGGEEMLTNPSVCLTVPLLCPCHCFHSWISEVFGPSWSCWTSQGNEEGNSLLSGQRPMSRFPWASVGPVIQSIKVDYCSRICLKAQICRIKQDVRW